MPIFPLATTSRTGWLGLACAVGVAAALWANSAPSRADDAEANARAALEAGAVVPLRQLLAHLQQQFPGRVLKVELEWEDDRHEQGWVYEVKLITPTGDVLKLEIDARDMTLLEVKGHHGGEHRRPGRRQEQDDDDDR